MQNTSLNKLRLVDQSVHKSLFYLSEAIQYYWPAKKYSKDVIHMVAENNIALHLARSFSENGFIVWAEIPFECNGSKKFDFLAYHYLFDTVVALELKNNVEDPPKNLADLARLVDIREHGITSEEHSLNPHAFMKDRKPDVYGVVNLLNYTEFAEWWMLPNLCGNYKPKDRPAPAYEEIGKALEASKAKAVIPLCEINHPDVNIKCRLIRAAYALYDESTIQDLAKIFPPRNTQKGSTEVVQSG